MKELELVLQQSKVVMDSADVKLSHKDDTNIGLRHDLAAARGTNLSETPRSAARNHNPHLSRAQSRTHRGVSELSVENPNESRVLRLIVTPIANNLVSKHTKSSMLRLKNSPKQSRVENADPAGRNRKRCISKRSSTSNSNVINAKKVKLTKVVGKKLSFGATTKGKVRGYNLRKR